MTTATIQPCPCKFSQPHAQQVHWNGVWKWQVQCNGCGRTGTIEVVEWEAVKSWNDDARLAAVQLTEQE